MELTTNHVSFKSVYWAMFATSISMAMVTSARAGDHHKTVYYLPVQAAPAPAPVVAAPVQYVTLPSKHHRTVLVQAATVQTVPVVQAAATPVMMMTSGTTGVAGSPMLVAASPTKPATVVYNNVTYTLVGQTTGGTVAGAPAVAGAPVLGGLTADQRAQILGQLKDYHQALKPISTLDADSIKEMVRVKAVSRYEETVKDAVNTDDEKKAVDSLTSEAIGATVTSTDTSKSSSTPGSTTSGATMMVVPAPAPVEYFLPVKIKHHPFHPFK